MPVQRVDDQSTTTASGHETEAGTSRGDARKRELHGLPYDQQVAALRPGGPADGGLLSPGRVRSAIAYNNRRKGELGTAWVQGMQQSLGVPAATPGSFDAPTVQGVAAFQDDHSLRVDGMVGPDTLRAMKQSLATPAPETSPETRTDATATAAPTAPAPTTATPTTPGAPTVDDTAEVAPPPLIRAEDGATDAEAPPAPPTVQAALRKVDGMLGPITSRIAGERLQLGLATSWIEYVNDAFATAAAALATAEPGDDLTALRASMSGAADWVASQLAQIGERVRTRVVALINASALLAQDRQEDPVLPDRAEVQALGAAIRALGAVAGAPGFEGVEGAREALTPAIATASDAVLATFQALAVASARETWRKGEATQEGAVADVARNRHQRNEVDEIFVDIGGQFGNRQSTRVNDKGQTIVADWCGMFVGAHLFRGAGLDEELRSGMLHTANVQDYFKYAQKANAGRVPRSIWADGQWWDLREYHASRGSVRQWTERTQVLASVASGTVDIRPGDVVLIDHSGERNAPEHITMVESFDAATGMLTTIEGNTKGIMADAEGAPQRTAAGDGFARTEGRDAVGLHQRDLTVQSGRTPRHRKGTAYETRPGSTVFGIGRPSMVDFEEHRYATRAVPPQFRHLSPEQIQAMANGPVNKTETTSAKRIDVKPAQ